MAITRIDINVTSRYIPNGSSFSAESYNDFIDETVLDFTSISSQWNENLVPLLKTLPDGTIDSAVNAFLSGLDGKTMWLDSSASNLVNTRYYNTVKSRPYTVKEQIDNIYSLLDSLNVTISNTSIISGGTSTSSGLTDTQKARIGINIFDNAQASSSNSLDGKSTINQLNLAQIEKDLYGATGVLNGTGNQSLTYSVREMLDALLELHSGNWSNDITLTPDTGGGGGGGGGTALFHNVIDYGAAGNGTGDDTFAINTALAAVAASTRKYLYFPSGTYIVDGVFNIPSNIIIFGDGAASIIKRKNSSSIVTPSPNGSLVHIIGKQNVIIKDIVFDGNQANNTATGSLGYECGVWIGADTPNNAPYSGTQSSNVLLHNVTIKNTIGHGIGCGGANNVLINECTTIDCGKTSGSAVAYGVLFSENTSNCFIKGGSHTKGHIASVCIWGTTSVNHTIVNSTIEVLKISKSSLTALHDGYHVLANNNIGNNQTFYSGQNVVQIDSCSNIDFVNNKVTVRYQSGIYTSFPSNTALRYKNINIDNNTFRTIAPLGEVTDQHSAIAICRMNGCSVTNNKVYGIFGNGIIAILAEHLNINTNLLIADASYFSGGPTLSYFNHGIRLHSITRSTIGDNTLQGWQWGIGERDESMDLDNDGTYPSKLNYISNNNAYDCWSPIESSGDGTIVAPLSKNVINVTRFGAIGDDSTDCTVPFQRALSSANSTGIGKVYVPDGTYLITGDLAGFSGVDLIGQSRGKTILRYSGTNQCIKLLNCNDVTLDNFTIRAVSGSGITVEASTSSDKICIKNLEINQLGVNGHGINFHCSGGYHYFPLIENVIVNGGVAGPRIDTRTGIKMTASSGAIIGPVIRGGRMWRLKYGFDFASTSYFQSSDTEFDDCTNTGGTGRYLIFRSGVGGGKISFRCEPIPAADKLFEVQSGASDILIESWFSGQGLSSYINNGVRIDIRGFDGSGVGEPHDIWSNPQSFSSHVRLSNVSFKTTAITTGTNYTITSFDNRIFSAPNTNRKMFYYVNNPIYPDQEITVKDSLGIAGTYPITISGTIDGQTSIQITEPYGSVTMQHVSGLNWNTI